MADEPPMHRALFREDEQGATVFFPWGLAHRGYRLPDDDAKKRAASAAALMLSGVVGTGVWAAHALQPVLEQETSGARDVLLSLAAPSAVLLLVLSGYAIYVGRLAERCPPSDLVVAREERLREAAAAVPPRRIRGVGLSLVGLGALAAWVAPHAWWMGALGVVLGLGVVVWSFVLARYAGEPGDPTQRS